MPWGSHSTLEATLAAIRTCKLLGEPVPRAKAVVAFIRDRMIQEGDDVGGFHSFELSGRKTQAAVYSSYWAVRALHELGAELPPAERVLGYLEGRARSAWGDVYDMGASDNVPNVDAIHFVTEIYAMYGDEPPDREAILRFLFLPKRGQEPNGGFESGLGDDWNGYDHDPRMQDTLHAVLTLERLDEPLRDDQTRRSRAARPRSDCIAWIRSCQNHDGSFARLGVSEQVPVLLPGEMAATSMAILALDALGADVPRPANARAPELERPAFVPDIRAPYVEVSYPRELQYFQRIARPIYQHHIDQGSNQTDALGQLMRWARAIFGSHCANSLNRGRSMMMHGWGQCGTEAFVFCQLATALGVKARVVGAVADSNAEALTSDERWDRPHWTSYSAFSNEWGNHSWAPITIGERADPPRGSDSWSALDYLMHYQQGGARIADLPPGVWKRFSIELVDFELGRYRTQRIRFTQGEAAYDSADAASAYPNRSW